MADVKPGDLVRFQFDKQSVLALVVIFNNGQVATLLLEGPHQGFLKRPSTDIIFRFTETVVVELPRNSSGWLTEELPDAALTACISGSDAYFVFHHRSDSILAADVNTGMLGEIPFRAHFLKGWEIWSSEAKEGKGLILKG